MPISVEAEIEIVRKVTSRYSRRCWWAEPAELRQVGHVACAEARHTYVAGAGDEPEGYFWTAVVLAVRRFLWSMSAPVSGGKHRPEKSYRGLHRTGIAGDDGCDETEQRSVHLVDQGPGQFAAVEEKQWRERVRARLIDVARVEGLIPVVPVLLEETTPREVATLLGIAPPAVHAMTARLRSRVVQDGTLWDLARARRG